jgi:hypothetical protein
MELGPPAIAAIYIQPTLLRGTRFLGAVFEAVVIA